MFLNRGKDMKIDNSKYILKGILLLICGVLFAFFPGVFSWIFYMIGAVIVIGSIATVIGGLGSGDAGGLLPAGIGGCLLGLFVMYLPQIISSQISIIAGIILAIVAITQIVKALSKDLTKKMKLLQLIFGCLLLVGSIFFIFNPKGENIIRIIIGLVMIGFSAFNFYVAYLINERNGGVISSDNIIDTHGYESKDNDHTKIQ